MEGRLVGVEFGSEAKSGHGQVSKEIQGDQSGGTGWAGRCGWK